MLTYSLLRACNFGPFQQFFSKKFMYFWLPFGVMGVVGADGVAEGLATEVGVYFGGGERGMTQHLLHSPQVGSVLHQLGGKTMAQ